MTNDLLKYTKEKKNKIYVLSLSFSFFFKRKSKMNISKEKLNFEWKKFIPLFIFAFHRVNVVDSLFVFQSEISQF